MLIKKWICLSLFVTATLFTPLALGHASSISNPELRADGGAPPPPPPWPKAVATAVYLS